jgi:hypothetical protein
MEKIHHKKFLILNELACKCVIGFSSFVEMIEMDHYFQLFSDIGLCVDMKIFFPKPIGFGGLNLFSFSFGRN